MFVQPGPLDSVEHRVVSFVDRPHAHCPEKASRLSTIRCRKASLSANFPYLILVTWTSCARGLTKSWSLCWKAGTGRLFSELYARFSGPMYVHAYNKLCDWEEARDSVQELFATLWTDRERIDIGGDLAS